MNAVKTKPKKKLPKAAEAPARELPPWGTHATSVRADVAPKELAPSPLNPRKHLDGEKVHELACLIRQDGFRGTLLARGVPDLTDKEGERKTLELIWGHHRRAAAIVAGCDSIPVEIIQADDRTVRRMQVAENRTRTDLHPLEEAAAFKALVEDGEPVEEIAAGLAISVALVRRRMRLATLAGPARDAFEKREIGVAHAEQLAAMTPADQAQLVEWVIEEEVSARRLAEEIATEHTTDLANAPWALEDATLDVTAGACSACPKRSGATPDLDMFPGVERGKDVCGDRACYDRKAQAHVDRARQEIERKEGEPAIAVMSAYSGPGYGATEAEKERARGALPEREWKRVSARTECPSMKPAVLVYADRGEGKVGDAFHVCTAGAKCKVHGEGKGRKEPDTYAKQQAAERKKKQAENEKRRATTAVVMADVRAASELSVDELAEVAGAFWTALWHEKRVEVLKARELKTDEYSRWGLPKPLKPATAAGGWALLAELALAQDEKLPAAWAKRRKVKPEPAATPAKAKKGGRK